MTVDGASSLMVAKLFPFIHSSARNRRQDHLQPLLDALEMVPGCVDSSFAVIPAANLCLPVS